MLLYFERSQGPVFFGDTRQPTTQGPMKCLPLFWPFPMLARLPCPDQTSDLRIYAVIAVSGPSLFPKSQFYIFQEAQLRRCKSGKTDRIDDHSELCGVTRHLILQKICQYLTLFCSPERNSKPCAPDDALPGGVAATWSLRVGGCFERYSRRRCTGA